MRRDNCFSAVAAVHTLHLHAAARVSVAESHSAVSFAPYTVHVHVLWNDFGLVHVQ